MLLTAKYAMESYERVLANKVSLIIPLITRYSRFVLIYFSTVVHIISITNFPLFCPNSAKKCLILPAECSPQKSLILLEILLAEFIQA